MEIGRPRDAGGFFQYLEDNLVAFLIGKTDWEYMRDCFCIFPKIGFHFIETERGFPNVVLTQCGADITPLAVKVDGVQPHSGVSFSNSQIMGTVVIGPDNRGPVKFTSCGFWPIAKTNEQAIVQGGGTVTFTACHFSGWANDNPDSPCVTVDNDGVAIITGTDFMDPAKKQAHIGENAGGLILTNSRLRGGAKITNQAKGAEVIIQDNLER